MVFKIKNTLEFTLMPTPNDRCAHVINYIKALYESFIIYKKNTIMVKSFLTFYNPNSRQTSFDTLDFLLRNISCKTLENESCIIKYKIGTM